MYIHDFMTIFFDQSENLYQTEKHNCNLAVLMNRLLIVTEFVENMGSKGQNVNCKSKVKHTIVGRMINQSTLSIQEDPCRHQ